MSAAARHGSSQGNSLRGQGLRSFGHKSLVLSGLRCAHVRTSTDESVTLVPDDLNHASNVANQCQLVPLHRSDPRWAKPRLETREPNAHAIADGEVSSLPPSSSARCAA